MTSVRRLCAALALTTGLLSHALAAGIVRPVILPGAAPLAAPTGAALAAPLAAFAQAAHIDTNHEAFPFVEPLMPLAHLAFMELAEPAVLPTGPSSPRPR